jgi:hypothetical protein
MAPTNPTGKALLRASLQLFRQDREMIWLPVMATVTGLVAFALVALPLVLALGHTRWVLLVALAGGSVLATAATVIFNVALVFAARDRIEGRTPTIARSMSLAWQRRGVIFRWALLAAVVGTAIRALENRLGLAGRLIGIAGGLAWAVATYLVVPVLAFEDAGPLEAVARSSSILKARFGTIARGGLRFGLLFVGLSLAALAVGLVGVVLVVRQVDLVGIPLIVVGVAAVIGVSMYASAAGMYLRTILYRFATNQTVPDLGVDVGGAFRTR